MASHDGDDTVRSQKKSAGSRNRLRMAARSHTLVNRYSFNSRPSCSRWPCRCPVDSPRTPRCTGENDTTLLDGCRDRPWPRVLPRVGGVCSRALAGGSGLVYRDTALDDEEAVMNGSKRRHVLTDNGQGVTGAVRALRAGDLGPVELVEECLKRIEASESEGRGMGRDRRGEREAHRGPAGRPFARGGAGAAAARNPHRGQGHHRRRRAADAGRVCLARRPSCGMRRPDREDPPRPRCDHPRQDRDHPVRVPGSGAHPQSLEPRTLSRRVERGQRGGGRERDVPGRARHPDRRVDHAPPRASAGSRASRVHGARGRSKASCR